MLRTVFNLFSMMFAKTSLLFCCSCIRLFVANYVCVVPYVLANIIENRLNTVRNMKNISENIQNRIGKQHLAMINNFGGDHPSYSTS